jgi:hypothetical protein
VGELKYHQVRNSNLLKGKARAIAEVPSMDRLLKACKDALILGKQEAAKKYHNQGAQMSRVGDFDRAISFYQLSLFTYPKVG